MLFQGGRLLVHILSPHHDDLEKRTHAFHVMTCNKSEELLTLMLPPGGSNGQKVRLACPARFDLHHAFDGTKKYVG